MGSDTFDSLPPITRSDSNLPPSPTHSKGDKSRKFPPSPLKAGSFRNSSVNSSFSKTSTTSLPRLVPSCSVSSNDPLGRCSACKCKHKHEPPFSAPASTVADDRVQVTEVGKLLLRMLIPSPPFQDMSRRNNIPSQEDRQSVYSSNTSATRRISHASFSPTQFSALQSQTPRSVFTGVSGTSAASKKRDAEELSPTEQYIQTQKQLKLEQRVKSLEDQRVGLVKKMEHKMAVAQEEDEHKFLLRCARLRDDRKSWYQDIMHTITGEDSRYSQNLKLLHRERWNKEWQKTVDGKTFMEGTSAYMGKDHYVSRWVPRRRFVDPSQNQQVVEVLDSLAGFKGNALARLNDASDDG